MKWLVVFGLMFAGWLSGEVSPAKIRLIYNTLDQRSVAQHLALYELYPDSDTGKQALDDALKLLSADGSNTPIVSIAAFKNAVEGIINLVNKQANQDCPQLDEDTLKNIELLGKSLPNKRLKGYYAWSESAVLALPAEEIDLARGLLLSEMGEASGIKGKIRSYEAMLDLMALQVLAHLPDNSKPVDKVKALNEFIFFEMGYRFPPHSQSVKDIDLYSFLPSVIDSRKGVCLGVSILYICLAQRLNLQLQIMTPPGHIFVRYEEAGTYINIETTARGVHLDDEVYLSIDTRSLQRRTIKETIGMVHFNQAAVYWQQDNSVKALQAYAKAKPYIPHDMLLKELMGYNYLLVGDIEEGKALMQEVRNHIPDYAVSKQTVAEDYLIGNGSPEGIRAIFMYVDENRESLLKKKIALEETLTRHPHFRAALFSLAGTWLQLHRLGEALNVLIQYHTIDDTDPSVEYYLAELYAQRMDYQKSWEHLKRAEVLVAERNHKPKALKTFRQKLSQIVPE